MEGFGGLQPKGKGRQPSDEIIAPEVLEQAILLRREVPSRSVSQLIQILEWEGRIAPGIGEAQHAARAARRPRRAPDQQGLHAQPHLRLAEQTSHH